MNLPRHKTKIVCTIGPASKDGAVIRQLIRAGMNVARLNFSHGMPADHALNIRTIRAVAEELNTAVTILADLPGPKIRVGRLKDEPVRLNKNEIVTLTTDPAGQWEGKIPVTYVDLPESVHRGSPIYMSDGAILLRVTSVSGRDVKCRVAIGGSLLSGKGVNLPGTKILLDPVSQRELDLVQFGIDNGISVFSVSFVEKKEDIEKVKSFARTKGVEVYAVAKIERSEAVRNIDSILSVADGIMVARGDLGVEMPIEEIPIIQKRLIRKANMWSRPVITATQMLLSMTENTRPTRAESTDVANAILDGTDAVMLSEETAMGSYPVETVRMMAKIAESAEKHRKELSPVRAGDVRDRRSREDADLADIISLAVYDAARIAKPRFVLTPTSTGATTRRVSRFRVVPWILSFSRSSEVAEFLGLSYGVYPFVLAAQNGDWHATIVDFLRQSGLGRSGDSLLLTEGQYSRSRRTTDSMCVFTLD